MATKKISELPLYTHADGLVTIGTDANKQSVKVPIGQTMKDVSNLLKGLAEIRTQMQALQERILMAINGTTAVYDDEIDVAEVLMESTTDYDKVVYIRSRNIFAAVNKDKYYNNWAGGDRPADLYLDDTRRNPLRNKIYICQGKAYAFEGADGTLTEICKSAGSSGGGSGDTAALEARLAKAEETIEELKNLLLMAAKV